MTWPAGPEPTHDRRYAGTCSRRRPTINVELMVEIDLTDADIECFERYEDLVLAVLELHGGEVLARVRDLPERREWHLLRFPTRTAWDAFRSDPQRLDHAWLLKRAHVTMQRYEVWPVQGGNRAR